MEDKQQQELRDILDGGPVPYIPAATRGHENFSALELWPTRINQPPGRDFLRAKSPVFLEHLARRFANLAIDVVSRSNFRSGEANPDRSAQ